MSDSILTFDAAGSPVLRPLRKARPSARSKQREPSKPWYLSDTRHPPHPFAGTAEALTRDELAELFSTSLENAGIELNAAAEETGLNFHFLPHLDDLIWKRSEVEAIVAERDRRRRQPSRRSSSPAPAPSRTRERFEFSASNAVSSGARSNAGITVADAAEQAGLSEDAMRERLLGKARLRVVNGELVASVADLQELAAAGKLPKPSEVRKVKQATAEAEGRQAASRDPAVEGRTARAAAAIGLDSDSITPPAQSADQAAVADRSEGVADALGVDMGASSKPKQNQDAATARTISADREPRRLGQPRRWSERT